MIKYQVPRNIKNKHLKTKKAFIGYKTDTGCVRLNKHRVKKLYKRGWTFNQSERRAWEFIESLIFTYHKSRRMI